MRTAKVPTTGSRAQSTSDTLVFPIVDDLATLTWLVNLAALELHVHQWTVGRNGQPRNADRLVIDLDPGEPAGLHECCQVALLVRDKLAERGLDAKPVTSGSKGLHLYADLPKRLPSDESSALAKEVAEELQGEHPKLVTATMTKARRSGKVFLDWSQNAGSKTTISPYSLRGRERPTVATPLSWAEVEAGADDPMALDQFRFEEVLERVADHGDLFAERDLRRSPDSVTKRWAARGGRVDRPWQRRSYLEARIIGAPGEAMTTTTTATTTARKFMLPLGSVVGAGVLAMVMGVPWTSASEGSSGIRLLADDNQGATLDDQSDRAR